jgi:hypothetical protein
MINPTETVPPSESESIPVVEELTTTRTQEKSYKLTYYDKMREEVVFLVVLNQADAGPAISGGRNSQTLIRICQEKMGQPSEYCNFWFGYCPETENPYLKKIMDKLTFAAATKWGVLSDMDKGPGVFAHLLSALKVDLP